MTEPTPPAPAVPAETAEPVAPRGPVPGLLCFQCGYDLQATPVESACPECGHPVADSLNGSMSRAQGERFRSGLVWLALSLALIPTTALLVAAQVISGSAGRGVVAFFCLMVAVEHAFWTIGMGRACDFAARQVSPGADPRPRSRARRAQTMAQVCAAFALSTLFLLAVAAFARRETGTGLLVLLTATLLIALAARAVSLLDGSAAASRGLRALRYPGAAAGLRWAALAGVLGCGVVGLGTLLLAVSTANTGLFRSDTLMSAASLLFVGVPAVWVLGLIGAIVCTVAAVKVNRRLPNLAAAAALNPPTDEAPAPPDADAR